MLAISPGQHQADKILEMVNSPSYNEISQLFDDCWGHENPSADTSKEDFHSSYISLWNSPLEQKVQNLEQGWNTVFPPSSVTFSPPLAHQDGSTGHSQGNINHVANHIEPLQPPSPSGMRGTSPHLSHGQVATRRRHPRKQNRACDPCRSLKRACNLSRNISIHKNKPSSACSTCIVRGVKCTVEWLASKRPVLQTFPQVKISPHPSHTEGSTDTGIAHGTSQRVPNKRLIDVLMSISTTEADLARQLTAQITCSQQFALYVDTFDMPISECLSEGSMPPSYSLGVTACIPLGYSTELSSYLAKADSWIKSCWQAKSDNPWCSAAAAPHLFRTVSILDALFGQRNKDMFPVSMASRDASITETYQWVAMATAAQIGVGKADTMGHVDTPGTQSASQDIALATWRKAKDMVFGNIAAFSSFRHALSMVLFGIILPPLATDERHKTFEEDAKYAFCEGIRRLRILCVGVRACFLKKESATAPTCPISFGKDEHKCLRAQDVPSDVRQNILELVGAIEWLVTMFNGVQIATSYGRICAFPPEMPYDEVHNSRGPQLNVDAALTQEDPESEQGIDSSILTRAKAARHAFTAIWRQGVPKDDTVIRAGRHLASLSILMWKSLGKLTVAAENVCTSKADYRDIHRHYDTTATLIQLWRSTFGTFDDTTKLYLPQSQRRSWRMFAYCSNDTDLAILLFYEIAQRLQTRLAQQVPTLEMGRLLHSLRASNAFHKEQRLLSAMQVSIVASTCQSVTSIDCRGQMELTCLQDISAHPVNIALR